jgi:hypothetical protein
VNEKIDLLFIILIHENKMKVSYYRVIFNGYHSTNDSDCPIAYYFKKYSLNNYLPLPIAKRYLTGEYVAVIPSSIEDTFINVIVKKENCIAILLKKEEYNHTDFENTYVHEVYERVGGVNSVTLSIFKSD